LFTGSHEIDDDNEILISLAVADKGMIRWFNSRNRLESAFPINPVDPEINIVLVRAFVDAMSLAVDPRSR
jgi:hypothetical protein